MNTLRIRAISLFLMLALILVSPLQVIHAAQQNGAFIADYWCNVTGAVCTDQNDALPLRLQSSAGTATTAGIVRFNVNTGWVIDKARLSLAHPQAPCPTESIIVNIYGTINDTDPAQRGALLMSIDAPLQVPFPGTHTVSAAYQHWTDDGSGDLATYLNLEREKDGVATLWIETTQATGSIFLQDNESVSLIGSCDGVAPLGAPVLQLSDDGSPLSVNLLNTQATTNSNNGLWMIPLLFISAFTTISIIVRKQQHIE